MQPILSIVDGKARVWRANPESRVRLHSADVGTPWDVPVVAEDGSSVVMVDAPEGNGSLEAVWVGYVPADRAVELAVSEGDFWRVIATVPGRGDEPTYARADLPQGMHHVRLRARTFDPFDDDLVHNEVPERCDLKIGWISDTQTVSRHTISKKADKAERHKETLRGMFRLMADQNCDAYIHSGDLVQFLSDSTNDPEGYGERELAFLWEAFEPIVAKAKPTLVIPGNHDNNCGADDSVFMSHFGGPLLDSPVAAHVGEVMTPGDPSAMWVRVPMPDGRALMILGLGYLVSGEQLDWASRVLTNHPEMPTILVVHDYLHPTMRPDGRGGVRSHNHDGVMAGWPHSEGQGQEIFEQLVAPHAQVGLVLCGHDNGNALVIDRNVSSPGHHVVQMMSNYQTYRIDGETRTGHVRVLSLDLDAGRMHVQTMSPVTDEPPCVFDRQPERQFTAEADNFTVPLALGGPRDCELKTEIFTVVRRMAAVIEELEPFESQFSVDPADYETLWASIDAPTQPVEPGHVIFTKMPDPAADEHGIVHLSNGTALYPDHSELHPDGRRYMADGTIHYPDGSIQSPTGTLRTPDGWAYHPAGTATSPDGRLVNPSHTGV